MYRLTCDGLPLLDCRDNELVLVNPKVNLEVNTVGEGSFTIYKNHPHYGSLKKLKSVFEVSDDHGVIFRGRATGDTVGFDHGMNVDLEGAMAYFNDTVVRPFDFPDAFLEDESYITAEANGERVAFFLGRLIDNHNSQVQDFQKMKLGNVTVKDQNFARSISEYASTWAVLKAKLFDSSLGGYLCIRYEEDGNYIDYLSEFTETNSQEIAFGENLLDLKKESEASETYSAIIPIGAAGLTLEGMADKDITDDIVKVGDTIYSKKAVEEYGWIYAPTEKTTWDEVVDDVDLLSTGVEWLQNGGIMLDGLEAKAVDLHFTDKQIESLRIYKKVNVRSVPHDVTQSFPLSKLEIELLNPQNTKITVGKTIKTLTEKTALQQEEAKKKYSKLSKTDEQILLEVHDVDGKVTELLVTIEGVTVQDQDGTTLIKGSSIETGTLYVKAANIDGKLKAEQIVLTGAITWDDLDSGVQSDINDRGISASRARTIINEELVSSPVIDGGNVISRTAFHLVPYGTESDTGKEVEFPCGSMGVAFGEDASGETTYGVAIASSETETDSYGYITCESGGFYVIVTNKGVRLQAGTQNITVTENGAFYNGVEIGSGSGSDVTVTPVWG